MPHTAPRPPAQPFAPQALPQETWASLWLLASVLVALTGAKAMAPVPYLGAAGLSFAAFWQLRAPLWRVERQGLGLDALGCHLRAWRMDLRLGCGLALVILPAYAWGYHLLVTQAPRLLQGVWPLSALHLAPAHLHVRLPADVPSAGAALVWFGGRVLTHTLGVALPEELFYRGYLQPLWQARWPAHRHIAGAPMGWASVAACAAFALGHVLGEWQLARLGPFFPGLLFAWQRARSGTILGAVGLHAVCNLFAEVWVRQYAAGHSGP